MTQPLDEVAAHELEIYIDNDSRFSPEGDGLGRIVAEGLQKKMDRGRYNHALAPKAWRYVTDAAAKAYAKEFAYAGDERQSFVPATRKAVAQAIADDFYNRRALGRAENPGMPRWSNYLGVR